MPAWITCWQTRYSAYCRYWKANTDMCWNFLHLCWMNMALSKGKTRRAATSYISTLPEVTLSLSQRPPLKRQGQKRRHILDVRQNTVATNADHVDIYEHDGYWPPNCVEPEPDDLSIITTTRRRGKVIYFSLLIRSLLCDLCTDAARLPG